MIELTIFGAVGLRDTTGRELEGLLRQPKRLALLLYLASPRPGHWHRRDLILTAFWPDSDEAKGRTALRNALYVLRQELGPGVILTRGEGEVAVDPAQFTCDAAALEEDLAQGRLREALARYRGEALPGFNIPDASGFERWLDEQRTRWRDGACHAAATLRRAASQAGNMAEAIAWQRRATEISPHSEQEVRVLIELLAEAGDAGGALATYDLLRARLAKDFGVSPSEATRQLVDRLRALSPVEAVAVPASSTTAAAPVAESPAVATWRGASQHRYWWAGAVVGLAVLGSAALAFSRPRSTGLAASRTTLLLYPLDDATGDSALAYLGRGLPGEIARRLAATGVVRARAVTAGDSGERGDSVGAVREVHGRMSVSNDSVLFDLTVTDPVAHDSRNLAPVRVERGEFDRAAGELQAQMIAAVHRAPIPFAPRRPAGRIDPEAFRLTLVGWQQLLGQGDVRDQATVLASARESFRQAINHDPSLARAWSGLSSTWAAAIATGRVPLEEGLAAGESAANHALALDSLEGTAWANLGVLAMIRQRSLAAAEPFFRRATAAEPGNAELYMIAASSLGWAWQWDAARESARIARALDPLSSYYMGREATLALCAGDAAEALPLFRREVTLNPREPEGRLGVARSLARLGRWDEAIAALGFFFPDSGRLTARGEAGYWALRHRLGEQQLAARLARRKQGGEWISPYLVATAEMGAGHLERGFTLLEAEAREGNWMLNKLPCNPDLDEVRSTARYAALLASVQRFATGH